MHPIYKLVGRSGDLGWYRYQQCLADVMGVQADHEFVACLN